MASVVALIKFTQGIAGTPGQVFVGTTGTLVTVENDSNTNVNSWQIDLVYTPPGSAVPVSVPLAFNDNDSTPTATFTPDVSGSFRLVLTVWAITGRTGSNFDRDIRNFVIPLPSNGLVIPPYQKDPDRLPTLASGQPGAKPNEMNINGTELGWAGDGTDGLLAEAIATIGTGGGGTGVNFRDILRMERPQGNLHTPINMVFDGTHLWSLKSNLNAQTSGIGQYNYGVVRIDPNTSTILESIDAGVAPDPNIATCLVWTGSRLFIFGHDANTTTDAWIQEVLPGNPTTFGIRTVILSGATDEGIFTAATFTIADKIWIGTQIGSVFRYDVLGLAIDLNPIVSDGNPILSMAFDPDGSHYGDATPRLFISRSSILTVERWKDVASLTPTTDDSYLTPSGGTALLVAAGFLWLVEPFPGGSPTLKKITLNPMGLSASTISFITNGFCYDLIYDPGTTKLWAAFTDGFGCGGPPAWFVERFSTGVLASDIVYTVNDLKVDQVIILGSIRPFGGIFGTDLWLCEPQAGNLDRGTFYKVALGTGVATEVNPSTLTSESLVGRIQVMTNTQDWDGVSDILLYVGILPGGVRIDFTNPSIGFELTLIDGTGLAASGSEVFLQGNVFPNSGNYNAISSAYGNIRAIYIGNGEWRIGRTQPANTTLQEVLQAGNSTGLTPYIPGQNVILSSGNSLITAAGQNPNDNGITLPIQAGDSGGGATGDGGQVAITAGSSVSTNGNGGGVTVNTGVGSGTGHGGDISVTGGNGGATGNGGFFTFTGGVGGAGAGVSGGWFTVTAGAGGAGGNGGTSIIRGGDAAGGATGAFVAAFGGVDTVSQNGGTAAVFAGDSGTGATGNGGLVQLLSGSAASTNGNGGDTTIDSGSGAGTGSGGSISLTSGNSGAGATGNGGVVNITAGSSASINGNGGDIVLTPGTKTGTGIDGVVHVVGKLTVDGLIDPTGLVLDEQASAPFDPTGLDKGLLYVKSGAPNTLWFRDDTGTEAQVSVGTPTLASVMLAGNTTPGGGTPLSITSGDNIQLTGDGGVFAIFYSTPGTATGGSIDLQAQSAGGVAGVGGSISINSGNASGTGAAGDINLSVGNPGLGTSGSVIYVQSGSEYLRIRNNFSTGSTGILASFSGAVAPTLTLGYLAANASNPGPGGHLVLAAQDAGPTGAGGDATLIAGTPTDGNGGAISVLAQAGVGTSRSGGAVSITAGDSTNAVTGGNVTITAGNSSTGTGGSIVLNPGTGSTPGTVTINGKLTVTGLIDPTGLVMDEQASAPFNPTGLNKGLIYVKSGAPNTLWFRDDSGAETQLGSGGATTLAAVLAGGNTTGGTNIDFTGGSGILITGDGVAFSETYSGAATATGGTITITAQTGGGASAGGDLAFNAGQGGATGVGGGVTISGGPGGGTSGNGGTITVQGGTATDGNGGAATVSGRAGVGTNRSGGALNLLSGNATGSGTGGLLQVTAGSGGVTGTPGTFTISGGAGGSTSGNGGAITISGGNATTGNGGLLTLRGGGVVTTGNGGGVTIQGRNGAGGTSSGGDVSLTAGNSVSSGLAGAVTIQAGVGGSTADGGQVNISGGDGGTTSGAGGQVTVQGGTSTDGDGGAVIVTGRNAVGTNRSGGNLTLTGGNATGSGLGGIIFITAGSGGTTGTAGNIFLTGGLAATGSTGGNVSVQGGTGNGAGAGGVPTIQGGNGGATGVGGAVNITGGTGGATSGAGGAVTVQGGTATDGNGGGATVSGRNGVGTNRNGGALTLSSGNATGSGTGGTVNLLAGSGGTTGTAGAVSISGGAGGTTSGAGGSASIQGGLPVDGNGGGINITGRDAATTTATSRNGGSIIGQAGVATVAGTGGTVQFNAGNAGTTGIAGSITLLAGAGGSTSGSGGTITIQAGSGTATAASGGTTLINGGNGGATGIGGVVTITGGSGGTTSGAGGAVTLQGGQPTDGDGGAVTVSGRSGIGTNRAGGALTLTSGNSTGSGTGGTLSITAGSGGTTGTAGSFTISGGAGGSTSGAGGSITIQGGLPVDGNGGGLTFTGRNGVGTNRSGGAVSITSGNATGTGTSGAVSITAGNGGTTSGNGGSITATAGNAGSGSAGNGGNILLVPGTKDGAGTPGIVQITGTGSEIRFDQNSAVPAAPGASKGAIWVKNTSPTVLIYTDSAGTDFDLVNGSTTTISPAQITANTNDYNPTGFSTAHVVRVNTDASHNLTGLDGAATVVRKLLINVGTNPLVLTNQDTNSSAANRFLIPGGGNITMQGDDSVNLYYDATTTRWRVV